MRLACLLRLIFYALCPVQCIIQGHPRYFTDCMGTHKVLFSLDNRQSPSFLFLVNIIKCVLLALTDSPVFTHHFSTLFTATYIMMTHRFWRTSMMNIKIYISMFLHIWWCLSGLNYLLFFSEAAVTHCLKYWSLTKLLVQYQPPLYVFAKPFTHYELNCKHWPLAGSFRCKHSVCQWSNFQSGKPRL